MENKNHRVGIEDCPTELIHQIVSDLSINDLIVLQTTSRFLQAKTVSILYRDIKWKFECPSTPKSPIYLLLRTLIHRPELGLFIRSLDFMQRFRICPVWVEDQPKLTDTELEQLAQKGRSNTNDSKPEDWLHQYVNTSTLIPVTHFKQARFKSQKTHYADHYSLKIGNHDAFVTLLLYYSPNIKKLVLQNNFSSTWSWNKECKTVPNYNTLWEAIVSLQDLEEIDCDKTGHTEIPWDVPRVPMLLRLPKITSIKLSIVDEEVCKEKGWNIPEYIRYNDPNLPPRRRGRLIGYKYRDPLTVDVHVDNIVAPNLKTLELYYSLVTEYAVGALVATAPNLTSLTVEFKRNAVKCYIDSWLDYDALRNALTANVNDQRPQSLLESITIKSKHKFWEGAAHDYSDGGPWLTENGNLDINAQSNFLYHGLKGSLGSLKQLTNLKRLELCPVALLGKFEL